MLVHNGKSFLPVNITPEMVGHKVCTLSPGTPGGSSGEVDS